MVYIYTRPLYKIIVHIDFVLSQNTFIALQTLEYVGLM